MRDVTLGCSCMRCWTTVLESKLAGTLQVACLTTVSIANSASRAVLQQQACKEVLMVQDVLNSSRRAVTQGMHACSGT